MTLPDFIQFFRALAGVHVALKGFAHGLVSRIIGGARSENEYPILWLETPTLGLLDKDGTAPYGQRSAAVVILQSAPKGGFAAQDAGARCACSSTTACNRPATAPRATRSSR